MPELTPEDLVTRFEVIDHRAGASPPGRVLACYDVQVTLARQDDGRTLKVFLDDRQESDLPADPGEAHWLPRPAEVAGLMQEIAGDVHER